MSFAFEKLDVYQKALDFVQLVDQLISELKGKAPYSTMDQLSRAAYSMPLNIAEGSGRWHKPEKRQFYRIAQ